jgi:hypothetical protein
MNKTLQALIDAGIISSDKIALAESLSPIRRDKEEREKLILVGQLDIRAKYGLPMSAHSDLLQYATGGVPKRKRAPNKKKISVIENPIPENPVPEVTVTEKKSTKKRK